MINDIFIIDKGGMCLFHQNLDMIRTNSKRNQQDIQLIAGFFTALDSFAQEINDKKEYIQCIVLSKSSYYFHSDGNYCAVLKTDSVNNLRTGDYVDILKDTLDDFTICLKTDYVNNYENLVIESPELVQRVKYHISEVTKRTLLRSYNPAQ